MKNKVKPNKQGAKTPFISYTKKEKGITLISIIVMVILLIILSVVSIKAITGEEGIIKVSSDATEDYNILQYKEQIEQLRESIILKEEISGESINLEKLAKEMSKEAIWIKSAVANVREDTSELNNDIIVTTADGYIFQLYYSESYGQKFLEYIGKEDGNAIPEMTISKINNKITVSAMEETSGINGIEIIYKGEVVKQEKACTIEYDTQKTGWYIIRAASNKGKLRYAWVRISSTMAGPKIEVIEPSSKPDNGWYKEKVVVRISASSEKTSKIYYTTSRWKEDPSLEITSSDQIDGNLGKDIEITLQGATSIYAYAIDGSSGESEIVRQDVLIDSDPPKVNDIIITGTKGENGWYRGEVGISLENAKDNASGLAGYYYYIPTAEEMSSNFIPEINQMLGENGQVDGIPIGIKTVMKITEDGIKTVIIRLEDRAGNISEPVTVTVKADNTPPSPTPVLKETAEGDLKQDGFILKIERESADISQVTYDYYAIVDGREMMLGSTREKELQVSGLKSDTNYTVYVNARDEAGNIAYGTENGIILKTKKALPQPSIIVEKLEGTTESNGWYTGEVKVKISYVADEAYGELKLKYKINSGNERTSSNVETEVGIISEEGITSIEAYTEDSGGEKSKVTIEEIKIDTSAPEKPIITVNGTTGDGEWYGANMQAVIQGGADSGSGAAKIKYKIIAEGEAEDNINWITEGRSTVTPDIVADGIYKIKAITIDRAGRESGIAERDVKKDSIAPEVTAFEVEKTTSFTITVKANGTDNKSGIYSYVFQCRQYGTSAWLASEEVTLEENENTEISYTYRKLQSGKQYEVRVIAKDRAGNTSKEKEIKISSKTNTAPTGLTVTVTKEVNYLTINTKATDAEGDELTYILLLGSSASDLTEVDTTTDPVNFPLVARDLDENKEYWIQVKVTDSDQVSVITPKRTNTLCSGTGVICSAWSQCTVCDDGGKCTHSWTRYSKSYSRYTCNTGHAVANANYGSALGFECQWCGGFAFYTNYNCQNTKRCRTRNRMV